MKYSVHRGEAAHAIRATGAAVGIVRGPAAGLGHRIRRNPCHDTIGGFRECRLQTRTAPPLDVGVREQQVAVVLVDVASPSDLSGRGEAHDGQRGIAVETDISVTAQNIAGPVVVSGHRDEIAQVLVAEFGKRQRADSFVSGTGEHPGFRQIIGQGAKVLKSSLNICSSELDQFKRAPFPHRNLEWKVAVVFVSKGVMGDPDLAQLAHAINLAAARLGLANDWEENHRQNSDDENDEQQFKQGEARPVLARFHRVHDRKWVLPYPVI